MVTRESRAGLFGGAWDRTKEFVGGAPGAVTGIFQPGPDRKLFQTDHRFDAFAAPVSFPFYATPPQATTEAKVLFLYDDVLPNQQAFPNADNFFLGGQLRLAVTDWLTLEVNKLGGMWVRPPGAGTRSGFSELWLGPKFTLIKNENSGSILAAGLTFQVPVGSANIVQHTGSLSLAPYVSFAQKFFPDFKYGSIILWNTTGYAFRTDNVRSEYLYSMFHVNWDILNLHMFYPEFGIGWNLYTRNGNAGNPAPNNFEGNDWFNFGNPFAGRSNLSLSTGLRWKINEHLQTGFAFQFGVLRTPNNWENWGATVDFRIIY
ncbi:MAG: transporter [Planctomycetes bacterium]|nr:transporter [Planctomycetota bacterium]